jgi:hypothetical protein
MAIRLTARPSFSRAGKRRPECFDVFLDNNPKPMLSSRQPALDACRVLLSRGYEPTLPVVMCHGDDQVISLRSVVGVGRLTIMGRRFVRRKNGTSRIGDG